MVSMVCHDLRDKEHVLEVAAGTGLVTAALAPVVTALTATDSSPDMLEILRGRLATAAQSDVKVMRANVMALDFPDAAFDGVVAANLLHLLPDVPSALVELRRVLRPDGVLCVPTFGHGETAVAHIASRLLSLVGFPVVSRYRRDTLRGAVEGCGFTTLREHVVPGVLPVLYLSARRT